MARSESGAPPTDLLVWVTYVWIAGGMTVAEATLAVGVTTDALAATFQQWGMTPAGYAAFSAWVEADRNRSRAWSVILTEADRPLPTVPREPGGSLIRDARTAS